VIPKASIAVATTSRAVVSYTKETNKGHQAHKIIVKAMIHY